MKVLLVFGTRPEAIKMAPVIHELCRRTDMVARICVTAQHREMLDQVLSLFEIRPNYDLDIMRPGQSLAYLTSRILDEIDKVLAIEQPEWVLVQGDTTTAMAVSLAAFYKQVRIGHVEAGLRTRNKYHPFPEEINRRIVDALADICFAPTEGARDNLRSEGVPDSAIRVTGNTVVDALLWIREQNLRHPPDLVDGLGEWLADHPMVLVTGHRRESFGGPFETICFALRDLAHHLCQVRFVYPVHPNPNVQNPAYGILSGIPNLRLIDPVPYGTFVWLMDRAELILTDSGGVQEEAPSLGKPVLVMREVTERPEGIEAGSARLVSTDRHLIVSEVTRLIQDPSARRAMIAAGNPYGDGHAAERILEALLA